MSTGENLKQIRQKNGISQGKLAEMINVSLHTIFRIENNKTQPRISDIKKLCEVLGVSEAELLNGPAQQEIQIRITIGQTDEWEEEKLNMTKEGFEISHAHLTPHNVSITLMLDVEKPWEHEDALDKVLNETKRRALIALQSQREMEKR
jgi:transcriptional regulator with XRE-family HTH domain